MLITTIAALIFQAVKYFISKDTVLFVVTVLLLVLAGFMVHEVIWVFVRRRK
ncbi:MAG: hypothetical protein NTW64_05840 [Candidatus Omnitrophica bacterium]|nr:hypothetical protein [Candidatus Omnitrophota bacterium]